MKKKRVVYSLTTRGLFSEIFNLLLAIVYAKINNEKIIVNTYHWNARINKGWEDYFEPTINSVNKFASSQLKVYTKEKIWFGSIYYNPKDFFRFYFTYIANRIYVFLHPKTELSDSIFAKIRSDKYFLNDNNEKIIRSISIILKHIFKLNKSSLVFINEQKVKMNLPKDYIGIHIRRGDKITTQEMNDINIDKYISEILNNKMISENVYIATDDSTVQNYVKLKLNAAGFNVFYNINITQCGFVEGVFNKKNIKERYYDTLNTLLDVEILSNSRLFIGTYSSNLSRIIPLMLGFDKCKSLDNDWQFF